MSGVQRGNSSANSSAKNQSLLAEGGMNSLNANLTSGKPAQASGEVAHVAGLVSESAGQSALGGVCVCVCTCLDSDSDAAACGLAG